MAEYEAALKDFQDANQPGRPTCFSAAGVPRASPTNAVAQVVPRRNS